MKHVKFEVAVGEVQGNVKLVVLGIYEYNQNNIDSPFTLTEYPVETNDDTLDAGQVFPDEIEKFMEGVTSEDGLVSFDLLIPWAYDNDEVSLRSSMYHQFGGDYDTDTAHHDDVGRPYISFGRDGRYSMQASEQGWYIYTS